MSLQILYNAQIYTLDPSMPEATAIVVHNDGYEGRIVAVGNDESILTHFQDAKMKYNLLGKTIMPGLTDAHIHLTNYALVFQRIDCEVPTKEECIVKVKEYASRTPTGNWIQGHGWNQNDWSTGFGNVSDLDSAAPNHPVYLTSKSLHAAWVNTYALRLAHIGKNTPDPSDGVIQRDKDGNPSGILLEGAASLVSKSIPETSETDLKRLLLKAQEKLLAFGITSVHDFDRRECFSALQEIHNEGKLLLRVTKSIPIDSLEAAIAIGLRTGYGDNHIRIGAVKMFADGALGPHTASMIDPYENTTDNRGILLMDSNEIYEQGLLAVKNGLSLAVHAIGDRANHEVINALGRLKQHNPYLRHRIEHVQLLQPSDNQRLSELGLIASMQPIHATSDMLMSDQYWGIRSKNAYAWKTQQNHGTILAFGSDAPVESPNPFWGIHAAVTRQREDGSPKPDGWYPEQRLTVHEAIEGFTTGPAKTNGMEQISGRIAPCYCADLLVMETDPYQCKPRDIRTILPQATMSGGVWVHGSP